MAMHRTRITLAPKPRGVHMVTRELLEALRDAGLPLDTVRIGSLHLLVRHTSAALFLTENASPDVHGDLDTWLRHVVPDGWPSFAHQFEGPDDMPAHVASLLFGVDLTLPVTDGRLDLGTWQGVALGEFRDAGGARSITATLHVND